MAPVETVLHLEVHFLFHLFRLNALLLDFLQVIYPEYQVRKKIRALKMLNRSLVSVVRLKRHKGITVHIVSNFVEEDYPTPPQNSADLFLKPEMMCLVHSVHIFCPDAPQGRSVHMERLILILPFYS